MPDIDLDFPDRDIILSKIKHRVALLPNGKKHNTGVYVTEIPHNPINDLSTIEHKEADERGYFKLDFLNVNIYKGVKDEEHLLKLMETDPQWELLLHKEFVDMLFHVNGHDDILKKLKPKSLEDLAAVLAIIRPAKRYLINHNWNKIREEVWIQPADNNQYYFKKSHAISYAMAVIVHMNLLCEEITSLGS